MNSSRNTECSMPEIGPRAPARTLVAVRAMVPVTHMPPNSADPILAKPCATNSQLERCLRPVMPSATTADSKDSIAPSNANAMASGRTACALANENNGHAGEGNCRGMPPKRVPMVSTGSRDRRYPGGMRAPHQGFQLRNEFARLPSRQRDAEEILELTHENDDGDAGGESHRHRIGNEFDVGAQPQQARSDQKHPGHR